MFDDRTEFTQFDELKIEGKELVQLGYFNTHLNGDRAMAWPYKCWPFRFHGREDLSHSTAIYDAINNKPLIELRVWTRPKNIHITMFDVAFEDQFVNAGLTLEWLFSEVLRNKILEVMGRFENLESITVTIPFTNLHWELLSVVGILLGASDAGALSKLLDQALPDHPARFDWSMLDNHWRTEQIYGQEFDTFRDGYYYLMSQTIPGAIDRILRSKGKIIGDSKRERMVIESFEIRPPMADEVIESQSMCVGIDFKLAREKDIVEQTWTANPLGRKKPMTTWKEFKASTADASQ